MLDPLSVVMGAGPMGAIAAWLLLEVRDLRNQLLKALSESAEAQRRLAETMSASAEIQRFRIAADEKLSSTIERFRSDMVAHLLVENETK